MQTKRYTLEELEQVKHLLSEDEYLTLLYQNFPSIWIEEHIPDPIKLDKKCDLRGYQVKIVNGIGKKKVLRLGRQLGKSFTIQSLILYYGCNFPEAKMLIIGPQKIHVDNIFDEMTNLIAASPYLKSMVKVNIKQPRKIQFVTGAIAKGFTTGEDSGGKGLSIRGSTCNILFVDEADYINDDVMEKVVMPTQNSFRDPIVFLSSTPTGRRGYFRKQWESGYYETFHVRACESPVWTKEKEAEIRASMPKLSYTHEYDAEFGEQESGIFTKEDLAVASTLSTLPFPSPSQPEGIKRQYSYKDDKDLLDSLIKPKKRILGVDWNHSKNGTRLVWVDFDENHNAYLRGKWKIDNSEFTQNAAMNKIIELNGNIQFDYIMCDIGFGRVQIEDMHLYGMRNPSSRLDKIVKGVKTDGTIEITDMATNGKRSTYIKNFIVESSIRFLEQNRIRLPIEENLQDLNKGSKKANLESASLADALSEYVIEKYTSNGRPIYGCNLEDHDIDAFMFTIYGYLTEIIKTQNLWEKMPVAKIRTISYDKIIANRFGSSEPEEGDKTINHYLASLQNRDDSGRSLQKERGYNGTYAESGNGPSRIINRVKVQRQTGRFGTSHTRLTKNGISRRIK
jgi:hypothetical protein